MINKNENDETVVEEEMEESAAEEESEGDAQLFSPPTQEAIDGWKSKHTAGVFGWEADIGLFVWRMPSESVWRKFTDDNAEGSRPRSEMLAELVNACLLHPSPTELREVRKAHPAITNTLAVRIQTEAAIKQKKAPKRL